MDLWAWKHGVVMDFSRPGKPTDNGFAEAFDSRVRAELLNVNWFLSLAGARAKCEAWRREYNTLRPHGSLGWKTPMEQAQALLGIPPPEGYGTGEILITGGPRSGCGPMVLGPT